MPQSQTTNQNDGNDDDPLKGRQIEDLDPSELQTLADYVYDKLRRELILDRERMGLTRPWPDQPR